MPEVYADWTGTSEMLKDWEILDVFVTTHQKSSGLSDGDLNMVYILFPFYWELWT